MLHLKTNLSYYVSYDNQGHLVLSEMELATQVHILDEAIGISLHANAFGKGINPSILYPVMGK